MKTREKRNISRWQTRKEKDEDIENDGNKATNDVEGQNEEEKLHGNDEDSIGKNNSDSESASESGSDSASKSDDDSEDE